MGLHCRWRKGWLRPFGQNRVRRGDMVARRIRVYRWPLLSPDWLQGGGGLESARDLVAEVGAGGGGSPVQAGADIGVWEVSLVGGVRGFTSQASLPPRFRSGGVAITGSRWLSSGGASGGLDTSPVHGCQQAQLPSSHQQSE